MNNMDISQATDELLKLQKELGELTEVLVETKEELAKVRANIADSQTVLNNERATVEVITKGKLTLQADIDALTETIAKLTVKKTSTENEIDSLEGHIEVLGEQISQLEAKRNDLTKAVSVENNLLSELELKSETLRTQTETLSQSVREKVIEIDTLKKTADTERITIANQAENMEAELRLLQSKKDNLLELIARNDAKYVEVVGMLNSLTTKVEQAETVLSDIESAQDRALSEGRVRNTELSNKRDQVLLELTEAQGTLQVTQNNLVEAQKEITSLRAGFLHLARREEKLRDFCDRNGIDHTNL